MPNLMVFLTTLGGIVVFGAAGLVIGPVLGALFLAIWDLWQAAKDNAQQEIRCFFRQVLLSRSPSSTQTEQS